jgi:hypothetical protein
MATKITDSRVMESGHGRGREIVRYPCKKKKAVGGRYRQTRFL